MKKYLYYLSALLVGIAVFTACGNDEAENPGELGSIVIEDESALRQMVYADSEQPELPIIFTTNGAWSTEVSGSMWEQSLDEISSVSGGQFGHFEWVTLIPGSGKKSGTHTIEIHIEKNTSGYSRSMEFTIWCGMAREKFEIIQLGENADGTIPEMDLI